MIPIYVVTEGSKSALDIQQAKSYLVATASLPYDNTQTYKTAILKL